MTERKYDREKGAAGSKADGYLSGTQNYVGRVLGH